MPVKARAGGQGRVRGGRAGAQQGSGGTPTNPSSGPDTPIVTFGTDLVAWYHADDATASSWPDRSSNGYNLVQATSGNQPAVSSTSFMGKSGVTLNGTSTFMKATGVALASDKFTVYAFAQYTPSANTNLRLVAYEGNAVGDDFTGPGSAVLIQALGDTGRLNGYRSGGLSGFWFSLAPDPQIPTPGVFYRMGSEWDGTNHTFYAEGEAASPVASTGSLASPGNLRIGSYMDGAAAFYQGVVREIVVTKNTVTSTQRQTIMDHLARNWTRVLLTEGDSITYSPPANGGFTYLFPPNASPPVLLQNRAIGGSRLFQLVARVSTNVYNQIPANKWGKEYIFFVGEGVNDIAHYGSLDTTAGPAQFAADIASYCAGVRAAGADKIAISTITSRTDSGAFPDHDAYRNPYNTIIRNPSWQAANGIDVVVDFAADSIMGVDQAPSVNPTYFQDEVHPNAAGHARLELIFRAAINGLS